MMPPHGHERPARSGSPPRAGFGVRPATDADPAGPGQDGWEQDERAASDSGSRSVFDPRRSDYPRPGRGQAAEGPRPTFDPNPDIASRRPRQRPPAGAAAAADFRAARPRPAPSGPVVAAPPPGYSERIEQLLLEAQRQIAEYARSAAADADLEASKIKAAAEGYAAGLRTSAEFERANSRAASEREAAKGKAAADREREDLIRAARREADDIRRREQFLLEQSEALRTQAETDLDVELAGRREEAQRLEAERLAEAQEATRKLVEEAERRAADAEKRAAEATGRAEQARKDAEADAKKEIADAHRKAELIIAQAKDDGKQALADFEADAAKRRAVLQKELDELTRQKAEIDDKLAQMRQLFAVGAFLDTPDS
jgi:hypothetical protein